MAAGTATTDHLGGFVPGGDPATRYPELWDWLVSTLGVRSVLDVGCGDGTGALAHFASLGCDVLGIDGVPQDDERIATHDFTTGPWGPVLGTRIENAYDLVWCCEFVEHVAEEHVGNFLDAFYAAPLVLMTHAEPGQQGYHHVNCQPSVYWQEKLAGIGYSLDVLLTDQTRRLAAVNQNPWNHYLRSGMAFRRTA